MEASLAIEAMRLHGGIFAEGFKGHLDFRTTLLAPAITLSPPGTGSAPVDALSAFWVTARPLESTGGSARVAFAESYFFAGPFPFVWTKSGAIYPVAPEVDLDFASQLARAPVLLVPPGKLRDAGARLHGAMRRRGISLPASEAFGLPAPEAPRLLLRIAGRPLDVEAELVAIYGVREFPLYPAAPVRPDRDADTEARARAFVERSGLAPNDAEAEGGGHVTVAGEAAVTFWTEGLMALQAEAAPKIEVEVAEVQRASPEGSPSPARAPWPIASARASGPGELDWL